MSHGLVGKGALALVAAVAAAACLLFIGPAPDASAKGKKLHACVVKNGPDKGVMHFSRKGKCPKGSKKVSWSKKGKQGKRGPVGQTGATGPRGPSGVTDELLATIATQQATIDQLTSQLNAVTSQLDALKTQLNGLAPQVAALCSQMPTVVTQSNALLTAITPIPLVGTLPTALATFACP